MAFLKTQRALPNLKLYGNPLPWTDRCKHLGTTITNKIDGCEEDIRIKNAMYTSHVIYNVTCWKYLLYFRKRLRHIFPDGRIDRLYRKMGEKKRAKMGALKTAF